LRRGSCVFQTQDLRGISGFPSCLRKKGKEEAMPGPPLNGTERLRSGSGGPPEESPSAEQLWSVIEFSRKFPELTLYLAADVKARKLADKNRLHPFEPDELLEFPPLVAPDPRELRTAHPLPGRKQEKAILLSEDLELFASGQLPPPESKPAPPPEKCAEQGKKSFWRSLLAFTF
jgi:hypothetical protein